MPVTTRSKAVIEGDVFQLVEALEEEENEQKSNKRTKPTKKKSKSKSTAPTAETNERKRNKGPINSLKCTICQETITNITSTHCGHQFCEGCISDAIRPQELLVEKHRYRRRPLISLCIIFLQCPLCHTRVKRREMKPLEFKVRKNAPEMEGKKEERSQSEIDQEPSKSVGKERKRAESKTDQESPKSGGKKSRLGGRAGKTVIVDLEGDSEDDSSRP